MAKETGKPVSQHVSDQIAQSPIRGALRSEDIDILNEVYGGLPIEKAAQRFKANRDAQGFVTNDAMLHEFKRLAQGIKRGPGKTWSVAD